MRKTIFFFLFSTLLLSCNQTPTEKLSPLEADAKQAADILCKSRELINKVGLEEENAMKNMEVFENDNAAILRSFSEKYPIHTAEGQEFVMLVNEKLEKCAE